MEKTCRKSGKLGQLNLYTRKGAEIMWTIREVLH